MAKFSGEVTFKVTFKDLGVPVGFGMTNAIIFHECDKIQKSNEAVNLGSTV